MAKLPLETKDIVVQSIWGSLIGLAVCWFLFFYLPT